MKMTLTAAPALAPRIYRKTLRVPQKRQPYGNSRYSMGKDGGIRDGIRVSLEGCDSSNDSGLGYDHFTGQTLRNKALMERRENSWSNVNLTTVRRRKMDVREDGAVVKDTGDMTSVNSCKITSLIRTTTSSSLLPQTNRTANHHNSSQARGQPRCMPINNRRAPSGPVTLTSQLSHVSRDGKVQLQIKCQPEQQHRARYQTEGSRGAVKDRAGNGFPVVKLIGYDKPVTLQIFIGTDVGRVTPHMFYQACRVSGKNSTPCVEKKIEGTVVIEVEMEPPKDMTVTCDCVGILKERNVDVEHRFPDQSGPRSKKKSTRCRMVFRTVITHNDGTTETLQSCSHPIICTQPPGVPEICKKSLTSAPAAGNVELFILGKNFLKDTRVVFQQCTVNGNGIREIVWEDSVAPDKEFLQQTHLVCVVPPYIRPDTVDAVSVNLFVTSSGKTSEPHPFTFTPTHSLNTSNNVPSLPYMPPRDDLRSIMFWNGMPTDIQPKPELDTGMMPPPNTSLVPTQRRGSTSMSGLMVTDTLKTEIMDETSQSSERYDNSMDTSAAMKVTEPLNFPTNIQPDVAIKTETEFIRKRTDSSSMDMETRRNSCYSINENSMDVMNDSSMMSENSVDEFQRNPQRNYERYPGNFAMNDNAMSSRRLTEMPEIDRSFAALGGSLTTTLGSNLGVNIGNNLNSNLGTNLTANMNSNLTPNLATNLPSTLGPSLMTDELRGIDLRMKITGADLNNTQSPSFETLRQLGMTENTNPLPAQSGQSVESYLTTIENTKASDGEPKMTNGSELSSMNRVNHLPNPISRQMTVFGQLLPVETQFQPVTCVTNFSGQLDKMMALNQPVQFGTNMTGFAATAKIDASVLPTAACESLMFPGSGIQATRIVERKTDLALAETTVINNQLLSQTRPQTTQFLSAEQQEVADNINALIEQNLLQPTAATVKLDAMVNSAVESHIAAAVDSASPSSSSQSTYLSPPAQMNPQLPASTLDQQLNNVSISRDATMTTATSSEIMRSEILLDPRVSPILITQIAQATGISADMEQKDIAHGLIQTNILGGGLEAQGTLGSVATITASVGAAPVAAAITESRFQPSSSPFLAVADAAVPLIPIPVKEMTKDKELTLNTPAATPKEGLITQEITNMSDNDLLSYINPKCFEQV